MRFANILFATVILSAGFGAAVAKSPARDGRASQRADTLNPSMTWLWQPVLRRPASGR